MHDTSNGNHSHDHQTHDHEHNHDGSHKLAHNNIEKSDLEKLSILLAHWIEHNKTNQESFAQWAAKANGMGKSDTSRSIEKAVEYMEMANSMLAEARERL